MFFRGVVYWLFRWLLPLCPERSGNTILVQDAADPLKAVAVEIPPERAFSGRESAARRENETPGHGGAEAA